MIYIHIIHNYFFKAIITQPKLRVELNARWKDLGPQIFYLPQSVNDITLIGNLWKNITDFYMKGNQFVSSTDVDSIQNFINVTIFYTVYLVQINKSIFLNLFFFSYTLIVQLSMAHTNQQ